MFRSFLILAVTTLAAVRPAAADPHEDFELAVRDATGRYGDAWVIRKFTTFKIGPKCWAKLQDPKGAGRSAAVHYAANVILFAKHITGESWSDIESEAQQQPAGSERQVELRKILEKKVDDFKSKFSLTIRVEGDDCDTARLHYSHWLVYWMNIGSALRDYPPKSGKAFITLDVNTKTKVTAVEVSKDGTRFTITGPRDLEPTNGVQIEAGFRKVSSKK